MFSLFRRFPANLLLLTLSVSVFAQSAPLIPSLMNFQGRLAKPDGTPVPDGPYRVRFSLWDAATGFLSGAAFLRHRRKAAL